jgi:hypothetical protein
LYQYHYKENRKLGYAIIADAKKYEDVTFGRKLPTIIFHGINDASVPYQVSIDYLTKHPDAHLILLNSDHGLLDRLDDIWRYTRLFLNI